MQHESGPTMTRRQALATAGVSAAAVAAGAVAAPGAALGRQTAEASVAGPEFWYQDNNLGEGGGVPPDFFSRYDALGTWDSARAAMHTFVLGQTTMTKHTLGQQPELLATMVAAHAGSNFAYNVLQATTWWWSHYRRTGEIPDGPPTYTATVNQLRTLRDAGFGVTDILLQSVLTKPGPDGFLGYGTDRRIRDVVEFNRQVRPEFPGVRIGIIDPLTNPEVYVPWRDAYRWLQADLRSTGSELDFIHFDKPFEHPRLELDSPNGVITWDRMVEVGEFVQQELGIAFGLQCSDGRAGRTSNNEFRRQVLDGVGAYVAHGGAADRYVLWPFYPYPDRSVPDTLGPLPPEGASQLRVFRELVNGLAA